MRKEMHNLHSNGIFGVGGEFFMNDKITLNNLKTINRGVVRVEYVRELYDLLERKERLNNMFKKVDETGNYDEFFKRLSNKFELNPNAINFFSDNNTYDFQKLDVWKMMFAGNMLVSHEMRLGKTYITSLPIIARDDIKKVVLVANISIASDEGGWTFALNNAAKVLDSKLNLINIPTRSTKISKIKGLIEYFNDDEFDTSVLIVNPAFLKTTIGKAFTTLSTSNRIINRETFATNVAKVLKDTSANIKWLANISKKTVSKTNYYETLKDFLIETFVKMYQTTIDLLVGDEIHEYLTFDGRLLLSSRTAKELLSYRAKKVNFMWGLTATPAKKSFAEAVGYHIFINYDISLSRTYSFSTIFENIRSNMLIIKYDNFNSIINEKVRFINNEAEQSFRSFEDNYRITRSQKEVNPIKKDIEVEIVKIKANEQQTEIYLNMLKENTFMGDIDSTSASIAQLTYLREISLDHRLIFNVIMSFVKTNINILKIGQNGLVRNLSYDNLIHSLKGFMTPSMTSKLMVELDKAMTNAEIETIVVDIINDYLIRTDVFKHRGAKSVYITDMINKSYDKLDKEPIVMFTEFSSFINDFLIDDIIKETKLTRDEIGVITGKTKNRSEVLNKFNSGDYKILIGNTKATSTGLNLSRSNHAIYMDLPWQDVLREQSFARIDSLSNNSTDKKITILSLETIANNSVDEYIAKYLEQNRKNIKYSIRHY